MHGQNHFKFISVTLKYTFMNKVLKLSASNYLPTFRSGVTSVSSEPSSPGALHLLFELEDDSNINRRNVGELLPEIHLSHARRTAASAELL
jgi:hypothetical protein